MEGLKFPTANRHCVIISYEDQGHDTKIFLPVWNNLAGEQKVVSSSMINYEDDGIEEP